MMCRRDALKNIGLYFSDSYIDFTNSVLNHHYKFTNKVSSSDQDEIQCPIPLSVSSVWPVYH